LGIPEDGIADKRLLKHHFQDKGFNHLLSLNSVIYLKTKLDVDLGYVANDRSEFVDSDVAGLHMKLKTFNYDAKYYLPKWVHWNQLLEFKECIKLIRT
jgi:iron complex outermembrane receptor protein